MPRLQRRQAFSRGSIHAAKGSLDDASGVVDPGDDEEFAYQRELALVEAEIERVQALLNAIRPIRLEGVTAVAFRGSGDSLPRIYLLPAHRDSEEFKAGLTAWVHARRDECNAVVEGDDSEAETAAYAKWTDAEADKEAVRLGAICPVTTWTDVCWDM